MDTVGQALVYHLSKTNQTRVHWSVKKCNKKEAPASEYSIEQVLAVQTSLYDLGSVLLENRDAACDGGKPLVWADFRP